MVEAKDVAMVGIALGIGILIWYLSQKPPEEISARIEGITVV